LPMKWAMKEFRPPHTPIIANPPQPNLTWLVVAFMFASIAQLHRLSGLSRFKFPMAMAMGENLILPHSLFPPT